MARRFHTAAIIFALAAVCFCCAKVGLLLTFANVGTSPVQPSTGIALAAFLLWGCRLWPGIFIGVVLTAISARVPVAAALGIAAGNTVEALVAVALIRKFAGGLSAFERTGTIFKFVVPIASVCVFIGASLGAASLCLVGFAVWGQYAGAWLTWWLGDMIGIVIVTPLLALAALVSKCKRAGEALRESERRFQQMAEGINEVFLITDSDRNQTIYISPAYEEVWGRTCESLYASPHSWVDALHPDDRERVMQASLAGKVSGQYDDTYRIIRPDGAIRWIHDRAFPVRDEQGNVSRILRVAEDITVRKLAEINLTMLGHAIESTSEMIWITDAQDRFVFANRAFLRNHDYAETDIFGKTPEILFSPRNPPKLMQEILKQTPLDSWHGEVLARRKDGKEFPIYLSVSLIRDENGRSFGLMGISKDVSERKRVQSWLRELASIVENSDDAIISATLDGTIVSWNKAAERIYGYPALEAIGSSVSILIPPSHENESSVIFGRIRRGEWTNNLETWRRKKDGSLIDVSLTLSPVRDHLGQITGVSVVARDITLRKSLEKKLLEISADERRRLGHDLHDGLGQFLLGIALKAKLLEETLTKGKFTEASRAREVVELVNTAITQTRNLAHSFDPIYVEANGLVAALRKLAVQTRELFQVECAFVCIQEHLDVNTQTGIAFYRIAQEAIHNAIRHGQSRRINLELAVDDAQLRLKISDDGKGFSPDAKSNSGMGLHIMRFRMGSIGGHLTIESQPDKGAQIECTVAAKLWLVKE